jgi:hypothetical protein
MTHKSKISRSVYQHAVEQNKKLLRDIRIMVMERGWKSLMVRIKWKDKFKHDTEMNNLIRTVAKKYIADHPELEMQYPKLFGKDVV